MLSFLPAVELGALMFLSKDMLALVRAYYVQLRAFVLDDESDGELGDCESSRAAVSMLRHCRQLRELTVSAQFVAAAWDRYRVGALLESVVVGNQQTLVRVTTARTSLALLAAQAACSNLTHFTESPISRQHHDGEPSDLSLLAG